MGILAVYGGEQSKEKEVAPLGSSQNWSVDFAVICASHRNLAQLVANGEFREDLLYRLQEYSLTLPPLREWPAPQAFILQLWQEMGGVQRGIQLTPDLIEQLAQYPWPGNIRQLRSLLKVLLALANDNQRLDYSCLPAQFQSAPQEESLSVRQQHDEALIAETLKRFKGNISKAAQALGVARSTLYRRGVRVKN